MKIKIFGASVLAVFIASLCYADDDALAMAKTLYQSASYQDALSVLGNLPSGTDLDEADKYRALCFLGLSKAQDAQRALEQLVTRRPLFKLDPLDSPKLVAAFRDVRAKLLPSLVKTLYASAQTAFDHGDFATASTQFNDVSAILKQPEMTSQSSLEDLKLLADGFGKLAAQQLAAQRPAPPQRVAAERPREEPAPAPAKSTVDVERIYNSNDVNVTPPVGISRKMPAWSRTAGLGAQTLTGTLEIVVDERGAVGTAAVARPIQPEYDRLLLAAAKRWQYRPAMLGGQPVKYRTAVTIVLRPNEVE
jgi:hypothetical protein